MFRKLASRLRGSDNEKASYVRNSYSQSGEDLIVEHIFQALRIDKPNFIDVGAHHPRFINNTYSFYLRGARGINIEPDPDLFQEFLKMRPDDINLNIGIGLTKGEADFYIMNQPTLSTFIREEADRMVRENTSCNIREVRRIKISPLHDVIQEYNKGMYPDFLSIDIEGLDDQILRSLDYSIGSPKVMCVETLTFSPAGKEQKKTELIKFIVDNGYIVYADTFINTIFVRKDVWENQ